MLYNEDIHKYIKAVAPYAMCHNNKRGNTVVDHNPRQDRLYVKIYNVYTFSDYNFDRLNEMLAKLGVSKNWPKIEVLNYGVVNNDGIVLRIVFQLS